MKPFEPIAGKLGKMHHAQITREPMPDFSEFDREQYPRALREHAGRQWWRRAREEYGSVHEFSRVLAALTRIGAPIELTGALARLLTDEARHVELCRNMSVAMVGQTYAHAQEWRATRAPFPSIPEADEAVLSWAADAILCSCCIGETLSLPLYQALIAVTTETVPRDVVRQILRDEHLHAAFGWEALAWILPQLADEERMWLQGRLANRLGGFEESCRGSQKLEDLVGRELIITPAKEGDPPNLGTQDPMHFALIFYATVETEVLPAFERLGFDAMEAWKQRHTTPAQRRFLPASAR